MARINNLTNFLTDVASAIKTKLGDSSSIPASQFDTKINSIKGIADGYASDLGLANNSSTTGTPYSTSNFRRIISLWVIEEIPYKQVSLPSATGLAYGFYLCKNLKKANLSGWNLSNITIMKGLFYGCGALEEAYISKGSTTYNISGISLLFKECTNLKRVDISGLGGSADVGEMFMACTNLEYIDISGLDISTCNNTSTMFGDPRYGVVPTTCEILVKNSTEKEFVENLGYTNVRIKS